MENATSTTARDMLGGPVLFLLATTLRDDVLAMASSSSSPVTASSAGEGPRPGRCAFSFASFLQPLLRLRCCLARPPPPPPPSFRHESTRGEFTFVIEKVDSEAQARVWREGGFLNQWVDEASKICHVLAGDWPRGRGRAARAPLILEEQRRREEEDRVAIQAWRSALRAFWKHLQATNFDRTGLAPADPLPRETFVSYVVRRKPKSPGFRGRADVDVPEVVLVLASSRRTPVDHSQNAAAEDAATHRADVGGLDATASVAGTAAAAALAESGGPTVAEDSGPSVSPLLVNGSALLLLAAAGRSPLEGGLELDLGATADGRGGGPLLLAGREHQTAARDQRPFYESSGILKKPNVTGLAIHDVSLSVWLHTFTANELIQHFADWDTSSSAPASSSTSSAPTSTPSEQQADGALLQKLRRLERKSRRGQENGGAGAAYTRAEIRELAAADWLRREAAEGDLVWPTLGVYFVIEEEEEKVDTGGA